MTGAGPGGEGGRDPGGTSWADGAEWLNPPPDWSVEGGVLTATSGERTDFWRETFYGFVRDNGHARLSRRNGDFSAVLRFDGAYSALYDQAGLMIRLGPDEWIKFGVELTDGAPHLSVVVTRGVSDWSARWLDSDGPLTIRATRLGTALLMQSRAPDGWRMERLAPIGAGQAGVGPFLCSPERAGFAARFLDFEVTGPQVRALHD